jgi:hypothetical protein
MVLPTDVLDYVGSTDTDFATTCLAEATALVEAFVGSAVVPSEIVDRAILETASELFHRRNAPSGLQQFAEMDGIPARLNRDPMTQSYSLLRKYVVAM